MRLSQHSVTHAENIPSGHGEHTPADRQVSVEHIAGVIGRAHMAGVATLLLHTFRPLSWVGGQFLYLFQPFLDSKGSNTTSNLAQLLERESSVDMLLNRLDAPQDRRTR